MRTGGIVLATVLLAAQIRAAIPEGTAAGYRILLREMSDDLAVFEVYLPQSEAHRKAVVHTVSDDEGAVIVTQKFSTANAHYKIAMIGSYVPGRGYVFRVDGRYSLSFTFDPTS